jgi:hypothetical protein
MKGLDGFADDTIDAIVPAVDRYERLRPTDVRG